MDPRACQHETRELRRRVVEGGAVQFWRQCVECGHAAGPVKKSEARGDEPDFDGEIRTRVWRESWEARAAEVEAQKQAMSFARRAEYTAYICSRAWAEKRELVLKRAAGVCEGCGKKPPAQVHHLTYDHLGDELLWELKAVCMDCHRRVHPDKGM